RLAALIPAPTRRASTAPGDDSRDSSRSARAFRAACDLGADSYEKMCEGLRQHPDPEIRDWVAEKGEASNERELKRIWGRMPRQPQVPRELDEEPPVGRPIDDHDTSSSWAALPSEEPWPEMGSEAFHGLAGQIVDAIAPTTESDPAALLAHVLVEFGNA